LFAAFTIKKRLTIWAGIVLAILFFPLILTVNGSHVDGQGWHWTVSDFAFIFIVLLGSAVVFELVARKMHTRAHRIALAASVLSGLLLVYINAAVGIIGEDNPGNLMYPGVIVLGLIVAAVGRFTAQAIIRALLVMATTLFIVTMVTPIFFSRFEPSPWKTVALDAMFIIFFLGSIQLFRQAERQGRK